MQQIPSPVLPQTRGESSSSKLLSTDSTSNQLVKWDSSKEGVMSAQATNNHPTTTRKKEPKKQLESVHQYTVGVITALAHEKAAVIAMLDEQHDTPREYSQQTQDNNSYSWGMMSGHNVAVVSLGAGTYGTTQTAHTVAPMLFSLPEMRFGLLVGIGAGVPQEHLDIRLGDVAISVPGSGNGGVYQYDAMKAKPNGMLEPNGFLNKPSDIVLKAVQSLQGKHYMEDSTVPEYLQEMVAKWPKMGKSAPSKPSFLHQGSTNDLLFPVHYHHVPGERNCGRCDPKMEAQREPRDSPDPVFHYGIIASGDTLVKDSIHRDELVKRIPGCICFEMEAAGLMNKLPCLVIRGICDYGDSHKNDIWQNYAAAVAAGYAKELLSAIAPVDVAKSKPASEATVQDVKKIMTKIGSIATKSQDDIEKKKLMNWIAPPDTSSAYKNARDLHQAGTCDWFLTSETFRRWKEGHLPFIWIHGIPGSGKTILSSSIIEHLKTKPQNTADVVLYFYFEYKTTANVTFDGMIRNFAAHLFPQNEKAQAALKRLQDANQSGLPPTKDLVKTFESMVRLFNRVQIVIDALDEIKSHEDLRLLLSWIEDRIGNPSRRIQLIVTSRKEEDIEKRLSSMGETIVLSSDVVKDDIKNYVEEKIREDPDLRKWDGSPEARNAIESKLIQRSDGMFRWVVCQLDALRACCNHEDLLETLESLPQTLEGTYTRILETITSKSQKQRQRAITILQLLLFYREELTTELLLDAIIVNPSQDPAFDRINQFREPRDLAKLCGALVTVDWDQHDPSFQKRPTGSFRIAHFSVREYLTNLDQVHPDFKHAFQASVANVWLIQIGLGYLSCIPANLGYRNTKKQYPFASCAMTWQYLARNLQQNKSVANAIKDFFAKDGGYHCFVHLYNRWGVIKDDPCAGQKDVSDPLWILMSLGLKNYLVTTMSESNIANLFRQALRVSNLGILRPRFPEFNPSGVPLQHDWWTEQPNQLSRPDEETSTTRPHHLVETPLYFATRIRWTSMVTSILQHDTESHIQGGYYGTALNAALYYDHQDIVTILQTHYDGLDPKQFTSAVVNTLKYAIASPRSSYFNPWMKQTLNRLTPENSDFNELLKVSLLYDKERFVDVALRNCIPTVTQAVMGSTFIDAIRFRNENLAQIIFRLVDKIAIRGPHRNHSSLATRALTETCDETYGRSTLHWAAERGWSSLTEDLVSLGADVRLKDRFGETPLHRAAGKGNTEVAEILILQGADTKAIDESYRVPLCSAFLNKRLDTCWTVSPSRLGNRSFQSLLHDIDSKGGSQEDHPRSKALDYEYLWKITGLKERIESDYPNAGYFLHKDLNLSYFQERVKCELESFEEYPLFELVDRLYNAIISREHEHVREVLRSTHIREVVNARLFKEEMCTPLHLAVSKGFHEIFCLLLGAGFNSNLMDLRGRTPMQILQPRKFGPEVYIPFFETFIKQGWSLDDPENPGHTYLDFVKIQGPFQDGTTCLHYAAQGGCQKIVNILLDNGADIAAQNNDGRTPLDYARAADQLDAFGIRLDPLIRPAELNNALKTSKAILHEARFTEPPKHEPRTIALARELHNAIRLSDFGTAHRLLETSDANLLFVNLVDSAGKSALHWAAENESPALVQSLLRLGAIINLDYEGHRMPPNHHANIKDDEGKTPLHCAAEAGKLQHVQILFQGGAHKWALDKQGRTPQELAFIGVSEAHREVGNWLGDQVSSESEVEAGEHDEEQEEDEEEEK